MTRAIPTTPPTTPPAITAVSELPLEDATGEDVLVDWVPLVELGTTEALPVTSGKSVPVPRIHKRCGSLAKIRTASRLRQRFIPGTRLWPRGNEKLDEKGIG